MHKFLPLFFLLLLSLARPATAQNRRVTGQVTSAEDGTPLPGVSVLVKGGTRGTQTDAGGNYTLNVPSDGGTLVVSFVGTVSQEIVIGNRNRVDVSLEADTRSLSEVVVTGYGSQSKRNLTGNIASVNAKDIENVPVGSPEQAIQGKVAGVQITALNGKVGQGLQIRIRGSSSVTASNQPLYVIDGIPVTSQSQSTDTSPTNPLGDLNSNDIESIQILKDAAASAIYGSRASNGVVLITTKKGKQGKTVFEFSTYVGFSKPTNLVQWMNTEQYVNYFTEARANSDALGIGPGSLTGLRNRFTRYAAGDTLGWREARTSTDWQGQAFQDAPVAQYDLTARGGDAKTRFYVSASYFDQSGILIKNRFRRLSGRVNLDHTATDKLTIGVSLNVARSINDRLSNDNAFSTPMQIVALPTMTPVIDPRTNLLSGNYTLYYNPLLNRDYASNVTATYRVFANVHADYKIIPGLSFRTEWGADILNQQEKSYLGRETARNSGATNGFAQQNWTQVANFTTNNFFSYGKTLAERHNIDATLGMSYQESRRDYSSVTGQQLPSNAYKEITSAAKITAGNGELTNFSFLSYFGRINYRYNDRYVLALVGRVDGSSRFGQNNRYGLFPSASVGWIVSEESFIKNIPAISLLKLRASYGLTGNAEVGNFASRGLYSAAYGYAGVPGQAPEQIENADLKWERTLQTDIGLEFGILKNRISGEIDYYEKKTTDLLLNVNVPGSTGFQRQLRNVGALENKGVEFVLTTQNVTGAFGWTTSLNAARNTNKITSLGGQVIEGGFINRAVEGQPLGVFFAPEYAGVDVQNGDALFYKNALQADGSLDRTTTNDYNGAQRVVLGNPNPTWIGGITNTFSYKGLELTVLFQGQFGNQIYNGGGKFQSANGDFFDNQTVSQLNSWKKPGDITNVPQARLYGGNGTNESSRYLQAADFVRLRTATLSYTLPTSLVSRVRLSRVRIYTTGVNLLTFTKYTGWDPEVNADYLAGNISLGNDFYSAPQAKTYTAGIQIGF